MEEKDRVRGLFSEVLTGERWWEFPRVSLLARFSVKKGWVWKCSEPLERKKKQQDVVKGVLLVF